MIQKRGLFSICIILFVGILLGVTLDRTVLSPAEADIGPLSGIVEGALTKAGNKTSGWVHNGLNEPIVIISVTGEKEELADMVSVSIPVRASERRAVSIPEGVGQYAILLSNNTCQFIMPEHYATVVVKYYRPFQQGPVAGEWPEIQQLTIVVDPE